VTVTANIIIPRRFDTEDKLNIMNEDARYEVGCDSDAESTALSCASDIAGRPGPPKIPKLYVSNACIFNCAYCGCRCGRDRERSYTFTPSEVANMAVEAARSNGHGVFVSSAIYKNADYTQELIAESVRLMRTEHQYKGFIHAKVMPGADPKLISKTGLYANRLSVNIEVAQSSGYEKIAKQKNKGLILAPMGAISEQIMEAKEDKRPFAASQTTQLMAGSTGEDDRIIMKLSAALYKKYRMKRVYYTAFHYRHTARGYENENIPMKETPYWRMARLYQADRLTQLYGFTPDDVTPECEPNLQEDIDPKAAWALRHLDLYPVEINKADYETLIRVPGIGITYAKRIIEARRHCTVTHELLKKMHVALKKSIYFITCNGVYRGGNILFSPELRRVLATERENLSIFTSLTVDEPDLLTHFSSGE
jgi:putative DNA modification/repair radical SAM protein